MNKTQRGTLRYVLALLVYNLKLKPVQVDNKFVWEILTGEWVRSTVRRRFCTITETHLVKSYAKKVQRQRRCTCPRWARRLVRNVDIQ